MAWLLDYPSKRILAFRTNRLAHTLSEARRKQDCLSRARFSRVGPVSTKQRPRLATKIRRRFSHGTYGTNTAPECLETQMDEPGNSRGSQPVLRNAGERP